MPAAPTRPRHAFRPTSTSGITLVEMLTVLAVIGILSGIIFAVGAGMTKGAKVSKTKAELASIAGALEAFKNAFGDYPRVANTDTGFPSVDSAVSEFDDRRKATVPGRQGPDLDPEPVPGPPVATTDRTYHLMRALMGRTNATRQPLQVRLSGTLYTKYARSFLDTSLFALERNAETDAPAPNPILPQPNAIIAADDPDFVNALVDPWGRRYAYWYRPATGTNLWTRPSFILLSAGPDGYVNSIFDPLVGDLQPVGDDVIFGQP